MNTKWNILKVFVLLVALLALAGLPPAAQAAPEPEDIAPGAPLTRQTITAGESYTCAIQTDGTIACWGGNPYGMLDNIPTGTFTQIDAYSIHTCAIRTDGTLACWGYNHADQATPPDGTFTQVTVGDAFSCGIRTDGTLACWGILPDDHEGVAFPIPTGTFTQISAGSRHVCALRTDGTLACWGRNDEGQSTPPEGTFLQVSAGYFNTCGIRPDRTLVCWGWNDFLEHDPNGSTFTSGTFTQVHASGGHTCALRTDGTVTCWRTTYVDDFRYSQGPRDNGIFVQVAAGGLHSCGLKADGTLYCWGNNQFGQVTGTPSPDSDPGVGTYYYASGTLPGSFGQRRVSAGVDHTCSIRPDGTVACWGDNTYGESTPPEGTFRQVSPGFGFTCGLKSDGTLACWGKNDKSQATPPEGTFTQISAGSDHTCALKTDGTVACWGSNTSGQLTDISTDTFVQISAGNTNTCGLRLDGTLACWGNNYYGQSTPPEGAFTQVSAGGVHACALRTDGMIACWGNNLSHVLDTIPTGTFTQVTAGRRHACALATDGTVACWGNPVGSYKAPSPAGKFVQISAGQSSQTCGTRADSMLECWIGGYGISPYSLPLVMSGAPYSQVLTGMGGTAPYTFRLTAGSLPPGVELSADGTLSGTPAEFGKYSFTVQAVDPNSLVFTKDYLLAVDLQSISDPVDITVDEGSLATFSASAVGTPSLSQQWEINGYGSNSWSPIDGATSTELTFTAYWQNRYQYRAVFSNADGSVATSAATLTVNAVAPTVTLNGPDVVNESETKSYTFTSSDPGGGDYFLVAQSCGANGTLSNASFNGSIGAGSFDCTFPDGPATSTVSVQVKDYTGAANDASTIEVTVANLVPQVGAVTVSPEPSILNGAAITSASFSDAGVNDAPFTCTVDYGDGSGSLPGTVDGMTCTGLAHTYAAVGSYTIVVAVTDKDGATGTASTAHSVLYNFVGFSQPVDNPVVLNIARAGQTIPLKFRLLDAAGNPVTNLDPASVKVTVASLACSAGTATDQITEYTSSASGLQNLGDGYYQWNWKTSTTYTNSCKTMKLDLGEGVGNEHTALFKFTK